MPNSHKTLIQEIFADGKSYFDALLNDINHAKESIDLEVYIFQKDFFE